MMIRSSFGNRSMGDISTAIFPLQKPFNSEVFRGRKLVVVRLVETAIFRKLGIGSVMEVLLPSPLASKKSSESSPGYGALSGELDDDPSDVGVRGWPLALVMVSAERGNREDEGGRRGRGGCRAIVGFDEIN